MKNIVIVGGSKGIGKAILEKQVQDNYVHNLSRSQPEISNFNLKHYSVNILEDELPTIEEVDTLIYCPGSITLKPILNLTLDTFRNDYEINVIGAVRAIQHFLPPLKKSPNANILLFSTVAVKLGMPFHASIAAAKAGVEGLVRTLGAELASTVRVNAIAPTITETELSSSILRNDRMKLLMKERHPLKNYLQPEEVAGLADYLISDSAKSISGQVFQMDYGMVSFKI
ncbi:SDR family NAD(P)-dependent oxidoreductase [Flavobacterium sp. TAB 87]|uniref:SDR family NAD(P)-dependent oxidoreductase n=1 Tax=Flavobacterium sp. TAB 87 TaxID=1729581 RepID=UPI00076DBD6D|nr:SDR family oxidoreductase [Flavobacterium sp. TAB 87]KVV15349.1 3-oxoacyl-[acyl-carrier-protein] reductase FabG1 [Flavobacterium sp. TAB 87]